MFLRGLLKKDPKRRFPLERVRDHEWTTMSVDPASYNFADVVDCSEYRNFKNILNKPYQIIIPA